MSNGNDRLEDASDRRRAQGLHDATCQNGNGPCWCQEIEEDDNGCGYDCGCDSLAEHDAGVEESMRDFLRNPGPPPKHFTPEMTERAQRGIDAAKAERGIK